jgi:ribosomal protein L37AE/L43A
MVKVSVIDNMSGEPLYGVFKCPICKEEIYRTIEAADIMVCMKCDHISHNINKLVLYKETRIHYHIYYTTVMDNSFTG